MQEKSNNKHITIRKILKNSNKLDLPSLKESLDTISPRLFHLYSWLNNKDSRAIFGCSLFPGESFTSFENLQIQLELWRFGEDWNEISLKLFGDKHYAARIKHHAEISGIYLILH